MGNESRRCRWVNPNDPMYVKYHDEEWSKPLHDERALYELFILETFQAGLSWATILHKRENFRRAYEGFIPERVAAFDAAKIEELMQDAGIIRKPPQNRGKHYKFPHISRDRTRVRLISTAISGALRMESPCAKAANFAQRHRSRMKSQRISNDAA